MKDRYEKIIRQVNLWDYFARIVPLVFIGVSAVVIYVDTENIKIVLLAGIVLFLITSISWWWWTIYTISNLSKVLKKAEDNLGEVLDQIREVKKEFNYDSNRERGKQENNRSESN